MKQSTVVRGGKMIAEDIEIPEVPISIRTISAQRKRAAALKRIVAKRKKTSKEVLVKQFFKSFLLLNL
jgi:hypothetical protein